MISKFFIFLFGSFLISACPPPMAIKPCICTSFPFEFDQKTRWTNVSCTYARSWNQIRDALHPFRRSDRYFIQTLFIEKIRDRLSDTRQLNGIFRHVRVAELIIVDSVMTVNGRVPKNIFKDASWISSLHLQDVGLKAVLTRTLRLLPILNELSLARNSLTSIGHRAFRYQLQSLKYLDLQRNRLVEIPSQSFEDLSHLEILLLNGNRIRRCSANAFNSTPNLEALELSDNELAFLDDQAFSGLFRLKHLGVAGNPLFATTYKAFQNIPSANGLLSLDISESRIDLKNSNQWPINTDQNLTSLVAQNHFQIINYESLSNYVSLTDLDLKGNMNMDPTQFQHPKILPTIRRLDATETSLSIDHLKIFPSLETVYLNSNEIRRLKQAHLSSLRSLAILHLSDCNIRQIEANAFWHLARTIREINLSHNRLKHLRRRIFHNLHAIYSIDLSHNRFRDYASDEELGIEDGHKDTFPLDKRFFDRNSSTSLRILLLAGNGLRRIPEKCLKNLRRLTQLDLSGNRIENIQLQLKQNIDLEQLNLQNNKISYIHPDAFRALNKLRILNLSWNQLTTINSVIFPMGLEQLEVARCFLRELQNPFLGGLRRLKTVDLSYNMLENVSERLFQQSKDTLIYVDLAINPLNCGCRLQPFLDWISTNEVILSADTRCFLPVELRYMRPLAASICFSNCPNDGKEKKQTDQFSHTCSPLFYENSTFI